MSSKSAKAVLASNHEKRKKKLSKTISRVVKRLSTLDLKEKNEQLQILQKQLLSLDKQLLKQKEDEVIKAKKDKAHKKKQKKSMNEENTNDGAQRIGSYRLLPLGIGVKSQVKSKVVNDGLNSAVSKRTKTPKDVVPTSNIKKKSSRQKCTELVNEYLTFESVNTDNQKESKKEKKKLKTLNEISKKMRKSSLDEHKIMNSIKVREKNLKISKGENKESDKCSEPEELKFSNFVSSSEQYYFLNAIGGCKVEKNSKIIVDEINASDASSRSKSCDAKDGNVIRVSKSKNENEKNKKNSYCRETPVNVSRSVARDQIANEISKFADGVSKITVTGNADLSNSTGLKKKTKKNKKKGQETNIECVSSIEKKIVNEVSKIADGVSKITVTGNADLSNSTGLEKERKKKKKSQETNIELRNVTAEVEEFIKKGVKEMQELENSDDAENACVTTTPSSFADGKKRKKHGKKKTKGSKEEEDNFEKYWSEAEVLAGLYDATLVSGQIRINARDYNTAYVSSKNESESDYLIEGIRNRNQALEGDIVVLYVLPESMWKVTTSAVQKTAKVVFIQETIHSRRGIGTLRLMADKNPEVALFSPNDSRLPRWQVPRHCCPPDFFSNSTKYKSVYFEGILINWITPKLSRGFVTKMLGEKGTVEAETMSLLCEADCDTTPIPQSMFEESVQDIVVDEKILSNRQDLRCECIFSIDPEGAKDLDDAMSCKKLPNGNYEVGVHISDVAFYMKQGTPFDKAVCRKATTVYLVQKAYHMLPQELCYLCSLTPGEDKLAFSVFWELTPSAEIVSHRFTRSIIHSCVQLTYVHAQEVINSPDATSYHFPEIKNNYTEKDCAEQIIQLHRLATILRKKRFDNGALKIEIPKLSFRLDPVSGSPISCSQYVLQESNWLIEEFMLLANFTVGKHIYKTYPDISLLRQHKPPNANGLAELKKTLEKVEVFIDTSSGAALYQSINQFGTGLDSEAKTVVLSNLVAKPMPKALYYASGLTKEASDFWHYALNEGYYTHFTSPIRRYADIIVHRLLAASLGYCEKPDYTPQDVQKAASISNKQKYCAKKAGELSSKLFFTIYVAENGPFIEQAAVLDVKDHSFDCVILRYGYITRVYTNNLTGDAKVAHQSEDGVSSLFVYWKENDNKKIKASIQLIKLFTVVTVEIKKSEAEFKLETRLLPFY